MASIGEALRAPYGRTGGTWRHVSGALGFLMLLAALLVIALLTSFNPEDPSWNHAVDAQPANLLGAGGATLADILVQVFGAATLLLPIVLLDWAVRLLAGRWLRLLWLRMLILPPLLFAAALALAIVPPPAQWPRQIGFGGAIGTIARHYADPFGASAALSAMAAAVMAGLLMLYVSGGIRSGETEAPAQRPEIVDEPEDREPRFHRQRTAFATLLARLRAKHAETGETSRREPSLGLVAPEREPSRLGEPPAPRVKRTADVIAAKGARRAEPARQAMLDLSPNPHLLPPLELLAEPPRHKTASINAEALQQNARLLEGVLEDFGVKGQIGMVRPGPVVTLYELEPAPGIKASRVVGLADDVARSMSAVSARIAAIPGRNVIGIE